MYNASIASLRTTKNVAKTNRCIKNIPVLLFFMSCFCTNAIAQQATAKGTVLDEYGRPLSGVSIVAKQSKASAESDADGKFSIQVQSKDKLLLFLFGYNAVSVNVNNASTNIVVKLTPDYKKQNDTINILYETKPTSKILGSVSAIYTNELTSTPAPLYAYALAGRLPGLYTQQTRGWEVSNNTGLLKQDVDGLYYPYDSKGLKGPNDNTEINLRLRGQAPVTIVDGVQRDIYTIDPENIESVSVLKDALSTILLGQRSSRGVILVTTKKPVSGKPHLSFTAQTGAQTPLSLPDPLSSYQYAYLYNEAQSNEDNQLSYTPSDFQSYKDRSDQYGHPDVNWFNTILKKNSPISRYSLNVTGGGSAARYHIGLGYLSDDALFRGSNPDYETNATIKRYSVNSNVNVDVTKYFNAKLQLFARVQEDNQPGGGTDNIISQMYSTPNNAYPLFNPDGSFGGTQSYQRNLYAQLTSSGYIENYTRDIFSNLDLNYNFDQFVPGLWAKVQSNISVYASNSTNRSAGVPSFKFSVGQSGDTTYNRYGSPSDQVNNFNLTYSAQFWYLQGAIGYTRSFDKNNFSGKIFYDRNESIYNFDLPETNQDIAATASYDFDGKYFAEAAINYSGNDRYPPNKQFGLFYAGGIGWNITNENFFKNSNSLKWINNLKLRATYGKTGNDNVGYFTWRESYRLDIVNPTYPIGISRASQAVTQQTTLANPSVTWEKADKFNTGLDLALFKDKFLFTADYYTDKYYDLLQNRGKQTSIIGIGYPSENLGINRYSGIELSTTFQDNYKDFNYSISGDVSFEKSKIIYSDEIVEKYPWNVRTGQPVGMTFGYIAEGLIQTQREAETSAHPAGYTLQPGDIKFKDLNNDGLIDQYDQTAIGEKKPLIYYGVTGSINYKGFDISLLIQGVANRKYILTDNSFGFGSQQGYSYIIGRWTPETGTASTFPRLTPGGNPNNDAVSTFWQRNGDYFRIKNAQIGYTIPFKLTNRLKLQTVRVFANGLNLFTNAQFSRVDPEVNGQVYPIQRVINFGINIKF